MASFTRRQVEVVRLAARGRRTIDEFVADLEITPAAVQADIDAIVAKLGVADASEFAAAYFYLTGDDPCPQLHAPSRRIS